MTEKTTNEGDQHEAVLAAEEALNDAVEQLLAAAAEFAAIPETPAFYNTQGCRLQFGGHQLYSLHTA